MPVGSKDEPGFQMGSEQTEQYDIYNRDYVDMIFFETVIEMRFFWVAKDLRVEIQTDKKSGRI